MTLFKRDNHYEEPSLGEGVRDSLFIIGAIVLAYTVFLVTDSWDELRRRGWI
jgi:hypothetical protein